MEENSSVGIKPNTIYQGDSLTVMKQWPNDCIDCCVTSPPYYSLRDYGVDGQLGLEKTPELYIERLTEIFEEVRRVLKPTGTLWLSLGDSYTGSGKGAWSKTDTQKEVYVPKPGGKETQCQKVLMNCKPKDLMGIPWMAAFALRAAGWYLRSDIIWSKPNTMPESVTDRPTKSHEYIFLMSKSKKYYYDADAIKEPYAESSIQAAKYPYNGHARKLYHKSGEQNPSESKKRILESIRNGSAGKNKPSVWRVPVNSYSGAHFATYPPALIKPCILAGCPKGGIVLDPFMGSGTTAQVALELSCRYVGIELNPEYIELAYKRIGMQERLF